VRLTAAARKAEDRDELQGLALAAIAVATGLAEALGLSVLLTNIMMGTILVNVINDFASPVMCCSSAWLGPA